MDVQTVRPGPAWSAQSVSELLDGGEADGAIFLAGNGSAISAGLTARQPKLSTTAAAVRLKRGKDEPADDPEHHGKEQGGVQDAHLNPAVLVLVLSLDQPHANASAHEDRDE